MEFTISATPAPTSNRHRPSRSIPTRPLTANAKQEPIHHPALSIGRFHFPAGVVRTLTWPLHKMNNWLYAFALKNMGLVRVSTTLTSTVGAQPPAMVLAASNSRPGVALKRTDVMQYVFVRLLCPNSQNPTPTLPVLQSSPSRKPLQRMRSCQSKRQFFNTVSSSSASGSPTTSTTGSSRMLSRRDTLNTVHLDLPDGGRCG